MSQNEKLSPDGPMIKVHIQGTSITPYYPEYHGDSYVEMLESEYNEYLMDVEKMIEWERHVITCLRPTQKLRESQAEMEKKG